MSDEVDRELDELLTRHLAGELDPQRGRALRAFEAEVHAQRHRRRWLMAASIGLIFVTGAALALWSSRRPAAVTPNVLAEKATPSPDVNSPRDVEQLVAWEASDEGVEDLQLSDRRVPARKVRREALETTQWFDPQRNATMRLTVPVEQVIFIQEDTY